jgi:RhtB (resistance to homoserine/threonine) family protein
MDVTQALLAFVAAAVILTLTPGVDTAMVLRSAAAGGPRQAVLAAAGICTGCLIWATAVSFGLGALLMASQLAFSVVKWAGAAYLLYLGLKLLLHPRDRFDAGNAGAAQVKAGQAKAGQAFRQGLLTNLLNPKIGVFYITFFPQFIPASVNVTMFSLLLAVIHVIVSLAWFAVIIAATVPMGHMLRRPRIVRALDRVTGGVFVAFGARLALTR